MWKLSTHLEFWLVPADSSNDADAEYKTLICSHVALSSRLWTESAELISDLLLAAPLGQMEFLL